MAHSETYINQLKAEIVRLKKVNHNLICDIESDDDYQFCDCEETQTIATMPCNKCGGMVEGVVMLGSSK